MLSIFLTGKALASDCVLALCFEAIRVIKEAAKIKRALGERGPNASRRQGSRFSANRVFLRKNVDSVIETDV